LVFEFINYFVLYNKGEYLKINKIFGYLSEAKLCDLNYVSNYNLSCLFQSFKIEDNELELTSSSEITFRYSEL
jgi:hypothetical protein